MHRTAPWKFLSVFIAALILLLIPTARTLERAASSLIKAEPALKPVLLVIGAIILLNLFWRYCKELLACHGIRIGLFTLTCLAAFLALTLQQILVPIELFHIALYSALSASLFRSLESERSRPGAFVIAFIIACLVGLVDEGLQWLHPQRVGDPRDVVLNTMSIMLGLLGSLPFPLQVKLEQKSIASEPHQQYGRAT